ncbi:MAG: hypothetical protein WDO06_03330 [Actinomycetota bacterium]
MLAIDSNKRYAPKEPTFPILLLYCQGTEKLEMWKSIPVLTTQLVSGTHLTLLEQPFVKEAALQSLEWIYSKESV